MVAPKETQITAEIIALQRVPGRNALSLLAMPAGKLHERLAIIALGINRGAAIRGEMRKEFLDPLVRLGRTGVLRFFALQRLGHFNSSWPALPCRAAGSRNLLCRFRPARDR